MSTLPHREAFHPLRDRVRMYLNRQNKQLISSFIPLPVSSTDIINRIISSFITELILNVILPSSVYLAAFVSKLSITCFTLTLSPYNTLGIDSSILDSNSIGFSPILGLINLARF